MTAASALAIWERVTGRFLFAAHTLFFHAPDRGGHLRVQGVFPHPLVLGTAIALVLPFAVVRILERRQTRLNVAASALLVTALVLTQGRGPLIAAILGLLVLAAATKGSRRLGLTAALGAAVLVFAFSPFGAHAVAKAVENPTSANGGFAVSYRQELLKQSFHWVNQHPLGAGPGRAAGLGLYAHVGNAGEGDLSISVDNAFAKYALELGWPGLLLFVLVLASLLAETRLLRPSPLRAALIGSQAAMLAASLTAATFTWAQILLIFWALAGVTFAARWFAIAEDADAGRGVEFRLSTRQNRMRKLAEGSASASP
jgi:hypothetical protein